MERIQRIKNVYGLNPLSTNIQIALVSFIYNVWSLTQKQQWLLENNHIKALANDIKQYQFSKWKKLWWLTKRRHAEYVIINVKAV
jgi:GH24 family phage-related lysozyme (muramidase)